MSDYPPDNQPAVQPDNSLDDPVEKLKKLQAQLQSNDQQLGALTKERDALKTDVESLTKSVEEINKAEAAYVRALTGLNDDKNKLKDYHAKLAMMLDGVLGPKKANVAEKIKQVEKKITDKINNVETAKGNFDKTAKGALDAQADLDAKQQAYDSYKNLQKELGDKIQKMQTFKTIIDKFDDAKPASMYVFLQELKVVLDTAEVPDQVAFETELNKRWRQLDEAKESTREKKLAAEAAKGVWASEQANLAGLVKSRVDDLLKATEEFN